jgi:ABC-type multidrug transport system ATPase subunit
MKQRFGIAQLLLNSPQLIIVDEPTAGLDPAERLRFLNILREIGTENTVIFSTHIVDDVKELCNEMAIMNGGCILQQTTPMQATDSLKGMIWQKTIPRDEFETAEVIYDLLSSGYNPDNSINIRVHSDVKPGPDFEVVTPDLEDVYFIALKADESMPA